MRTYRRYTKYYGASGNAASAIARDAIIGNFPTDAEGFVTFQFCKTYKNIYMEKTDENRISMYALLILNSTY